VKYDSSRNHRSRLKSSLRSCTRVFAKLRRRLRGAESLSCWRSQRRPRVAASTNRQPFFRCQRILRAAAATLRLCLRLLARFDKVAPDILLRNVLSIFHTTCPYGPRRPVTTPAWTETPLPAANLAPTLAADPPRPLDHEFSPRAGPDRETKPKNAMAQPPPPTGSAAARSALAQKLSGVPPDYFVIKLYQMLQEQREVLTWDPDGGIIIHDRQRLEATLSVYFRHNRFTSFQRQLNNFGFHKKRKPTACLSGTAAQQRKGAAYDHPLLVGQQPEAVLRLRRDARPRQPRGEASPRRSTARQRSARAPPVGEGAFNLLADVAATELRRENSRGELEADAELLTRNASSSEDLEDRGASASPPRVSDSEGRTSSEERSSSVASSENRNERSSSRDDDGSGSGSDDGHRRQQHPDAPPAIVGGSPRRSPQKPFPVLLKDMLDATSDQILAWSADGSAFEIRDAEALQRDVLPKFFRHVCAGVLEPSRRWRMTGR
jgi:hypothetical protein